MTTQAEIDAYLANNKITQLSATDNKLHESSSFKRYPKPSKEALARKKASTRIDRFKDALLTGEIVSDFEAIGCASRRNMAQYVGIMRLAGWEIETLPGIGYKLIKAGGYFTTSRNKDRPSC